MSDRTARRRASRLFPWLVVIIAAAGLSSCLALTAWTYLQEGELKDLRAVLQAEQQARSTSEAQFVTLQNTAAALQTRMAALEGDPAAAASAMQGDGTLQRIEGLETAVAGLQVDVQEMRSALREASIGTQDQAPAVTEAPAAVEVARTSPETARLSVARQQQSHNLSCESSAASMAAQYHGVPLTEAEVIALLPANSNPHLGFRGNLDGPTGSIIDYGVYAGPIADILNARGLQARMVSGGLEGIKAAVAAGNPVIAWVTYNCLPSTPTTELIDGQEVTLVPNQHVVVVTGFDAGGVWANDPWDGQEDYYPSTEFVRAMGYFGDMAIEVARP